MFPFNYLTFPTNKLIDLCLMPFAWTILIPLECCVVAPWNFMFEGAIICTIIFAICVIVLPVVIIVGLYFAYYFYNVASTTTTS